MDALTIGWLITRGELTQDESGVKVSTRARKDVVVETPGGERKVFDYLIQARTYLQGLGVDTEQGWK